MSRLIRTTAELLVLRIAFIILLTLASIIGCDGPTEAQSWETDAVVGTTTGFQAPAFTLLDTSNNQVSLKQFRGKIVVVDFWASWCAPCLRELPTLRDIQQRYGDSGVVIIGVSEDFSRTSWRRYLSNISLEWIHVYDDAGAASVATRYGVEGIPSNFVLDRFGVIEATNIYGKDLVSQVEALVRR